MNETGLTRAEIKKQMSEAAGRSPEIKKKIAERIANKIKN